jgi:hypothetical protein
MKRVRHLWRQPLARAAFIVPIVVLLLGTGVLAFGHAGPAHAAASSSSIHADNGRFKHVFIIMMENTGIEALLGNPNVPWINQEILFSQEQSLISMGDSFLSSIVAQITSSPV